ncbi:hypothetical protein [Psychroflexus aestuariivivens]|uniref:hypothetical protein n=1 Tax=Psychroflexus aestuariivivens TaxID=1795040 RepID=UPI000FD73306|nr:hypothetical protein [Psychroflexus aestuariivivens]
MEKLIDRVWEYSQNNPEGFTLNLETMKAVKFGIVVAYNETQNSFGKEALKTVISHSLNHSKKIGGWLNDENGFYYYDSVKIFKNSELEKAIEFAKEHNQLAVFDLTNLNEIKIK